MANGPVPTDHKNGGWVNWLPRATAAFALLATGIALLSYVYTQGRQVQDVQGRLDRNCRILATVQSDLRFLIVEHTGKESEAEAFREIFRRSLIEACG